MEWTISDQMVSSTILYSALRPRRVVIDMLTMTMHLVYCLTPSYYVMPAEEMEIEGIANPMCEVFPRVASCRYYRFGTGGEESGRPG